MLRKFSFTILVGLFMSGQVRAQGDAHSAPIINPFSLGPDNLGAIANSVNQFTGDIAMPLNLVSFPGRGVGIDVSIFYSSANIETLAPGWNLDYPTGILGLGWSMPLSQIVVDNKQTALRDDDDFYLQENGSSVKLICVGINGGVRTYKTKLYSNKIITYTSSTERWDITLDDGTKLVYGDKNNFPTAVQWTVYWGNWIGNSNRSVPASQGVTWNLATSTNVWGDQIKYTYLKVENAVGNSGYAIFQTEASYLSMITDTQGHEVDFAYKNKLSTEFMEPHTEQVEPDAYQEKYEQLYLDRIFVKTDGTQYYEIDFRYVFNTFGVPVAGNSNKRLLTSLSKVAPSGTMQTPIMDFAYQASGPMAGALNLVKTPYGGTVTFQYSPTPVAITHPATTQNLTAPAGYGEPQIFPQDDYTVVTWRHLLNGVNGSHDQNSEDVQVSINSWIGEWKTATPVSIGYVKRLGSSTGPQDFLVATQADFFAVLVQFGTTTFNLYIWRKDEHKVGSWTYFTAQMDFGASADLTKKQLFVGNNFVAVSNNYGTIWRYVWNGSIWNAGPHITETARTHFTTATNNYIISHDPATSPDQINFYFLDEQKNWQAPMAFPSTWDNGPGSAIWYAANTHAIVIPDGGSTKMIHWNVSGNFSQIDKGIIYGANTSVYPAESLTGMVPVSSPQAKALRYDGVDWLDVGQTVSSDVSVLGDDIFAGKVTTQYSTFDPNTGIWSPPQGATYVNGTLIATGITTVLGVGYSIMNYGLRYRLPNGYTTFQGLGAPFQDGYGGTYGGPGFFINNNRLFYFNNGSVTNSQFNLGAIVSQGYVGLVNPGDPVPTFFVGSKSLALVTSGNSVINATTLTLLRIDAKSANGTFNDYPVTLVTNSDGVKPYYTSYLYDVTYAITDPSRSVAQYNKVYTIKGIQSTTTSNAPYGYTATYFFNGLSDSEIGDQYINGASYGYPSDNYRELLGARYRINNYAADNSQVSLTEFGYYVKGAMGLDGFYQQVGLPILNSLGTQVDCVYKPLLGVTLSLTATGGTSTLDTYTIYTYNSYLQLSVQDVSTLAGATMASKLSGATQERVKTTYNYCWQNYPVTVLAMNMLTPIFQVTKTVNTNQDVESHVTRYKENWPCTSPTCFTSTVPAGYDTYSWKGTNTSAFTWPAVASQTPSSDWVFESRINQRDNYNGVETEIQGKASQVKSQIWDVNRRSVVATAMNSYANLSAYSSFEDASKGNWSWGVDCSTLSGNAKTGTHYLNLGSTGVSKTGLNLTDTYTISFWALSTGGSVNISGVSGSVPIGNVSTWTLFQYNITNVTTLTLSLTGATPVYIDELRILPSNGQMSTQTYHPLFGPTSYTNANNQAKFIAYDVLGRPINGLDESGNIVSNTIYNLQK